MSIADVPVSQAPDQILQQALQGQVPEIKPYEALTELNSRVKAKQAMMAMMGNNAIAQARQMRQQPPIAAQVAQANNALNQGIGGLPVPESHAFSGGGIVAFNSGGPTSSYAAPYASLLRYEAPYNNDSQESRDRAAIIGKLADIGGALAGLAAAGIDVTTMPIRALAGAYNTLIRAPRAFGVGLPFVPKEFGTESMTPMYDKYFGSEKSVDTPHFSDARFSGPSYSGTVRTDEVETPEVVKPSPTPTQIPAAPRSGATVSRAPAPAPAPVPRKDYKYAIPKIEAPTARTIEELEAELTGRVDPRMSEYDKRMEKYRQRAAAMERGEGIETPSRLDRGIGGFMAGAADEVAAARRAGVRPSLGMALAGAARSAKAEDKEREQLRRQMEEKGMQLNMLMDQRREAYEAGQYERANVLSQAAKKTESEALAARNRMEEHEAAAKNKETERDFRERQLAQQAQLQREGFATQKAVAGMRADGGGVGTKLNPLQLANLRLNIQKEVDDQLVTDPQYLGMKRKNPQGAAQYRMDMINAAYNDAIAAAQGGLTQQAIPAPATPSLSPQQRALIEKYLKP